MTECNICRPETRHSPWLGAPPPPHCRIWRQFQIFGSLTSWPSTGLAIGNAARATWIHVDCGWLPTKLSSPGTDRPRPGKTNAASVSKDRAIRGAEENQKTYVKRMQSVRLKDSLTTWTNAWLCDGWSALFEPSKIWIWTIERHSWHDLPPERDLCLQLSFLNKYLLIIKPY